MALAYAVDTRVDRSPAMGSARAATLATPTLAARLRSTPATRGDAAWARLAAAGGYRSVTVTRNRDDGGPTATSSTATAGVYVVTLTDHPGGLYAQLTALVQLRRTDGGPWEVVSLQVR